MQPLDLYLNVSQNITISCSGKNEVHLSGYFEPNNSLDDAMYGQEEMDDEDEDALWTQLPDVCREGALPFMFQSSIDAEKGASVTPACPTPPRATRSAE